MPTLTLHFNYPEDDNLHFEGSVRFASDFATGGGSDTISIRGLGEWRDPLAKDSKTIYVSKNFMERVLTPRRLANFEGSDIKIAGLKANHDILLPKALRDKGETYIKNILTKFFKTISSSAVVNLESQASDEDTQN